MRAQGVRRRGAARTLRVLRVLRARLAARVRLTACALLALSACSQRLEVLSPPLPAMLPASHDAGTPDPDDLGDVSAGDAGLDAGAAPASPCGSCGALRLCAVDTCVDTGGITSLSSWLWHSCKVQDGRLYCWGNNPLGQLGTGDGQRHLVPTRIGTFNDWLQVAAGETHTCAIRAPGLVYCFGDNASGQLATGDAAPRPTPTPVAMPWLVRSIACGGNNCCALSGDGELACWGDNLEGKVGQDDAFGAADVTRPLIVEPGTRYARVALGQGHVCAIRQSGELYCWGRNNLGQTGIGSIDPGQTRAPQRVGDASDWRNVSCSQHHSCGVRADGSLWCWGQNEHHEVTPEATDVLYPTPQQVGSDLDWQEVAVGWFHSCAFEQGGRAFCWGRAIEGQLAIESVDPIADPNPIAMPAFSQLSLGAFFSCGLDLDRAVYCWGENHEGQLGLGDMDRRYVPTLVP